MHKDLRTALRVAENLQAAAAVHARRAFNGGPDFFGEEEILKGFEHHLRDHGLAPEEAARAAEGLRTADYKANPTVTLDPQREVRARRAPAWVAPDEIKRVPAEDVELEAGLREAAAAPSACLEGTRPPRSRPTATGTRATLLPPATAAPRSSRAP